MDSLFKKVWGNVLYLAFSDGSVYITNFLIALLAARYLGAQGFGQFSIAYSLAAILSMGTDFGVNNVLTRDISREKIYKDSMFTKAMMLRLILSFVVLILSTIIALVSFHDRTMQVVTVLLVASMAVYSTNTTIFSVWRAENKFRNELIIKGLNKVLSLVFIIMVILYKLNVVYISLAYLVPALIAFGISLCLTQFKLSKGYSMRELIKKSWPFGAIIFLTTLYLRNSTIILSHYVSIKEIGLYNVALNIFLALFLFPSTVNGVLYPLLAKIKSRIIRESSIVRQYNLIFLVASSISIAVVFAFSKIGIRLLYGAEFADSAKLLYVFSFAAIPFFLNSMYWVLFSVREKQGTLCAVVIVQTILNVILNLVLIPYFMAFGAIYSFFITEICAYVAYKILWRKEKIEIRATYRARLQHLK